MGRVEWATKDIANTERVQWMLKMSFGVEKLDEDRRYMVS